MTPEFFRSLTLDRIGPDGFDITVTADAAECAALALRMHLPEIQSLTCRFRLGAGLTGCVDATGSLQARITQICIVSMDDFPAMIAEDFTVRFVPSGMENEDPEIDSPDEIPFTGAVLDLGEAAAEQLALALDPYPRKPGAILDAAVAASPENPFAGLARLRRGGLIRPADGLPASPRSPPRRPFPAIRAYARADGGGRRSALLRASIHARLAEVTVIFTNSYIARSHDAN